jgi:hypothetical protein
LRATAKEMGQRKTVAQCSVFADDEECSKGEVVSVRVPPEWAQDE